MFLPFQNTRVYIWGPVKGYQGWTGPGFMRVVEGDALVFKGITVDFPMYYDIVIRFDPRVGSLGHRTISASRSREILNTLKPLYTATL